MEYNNYNNDTKTTLFNNRRTPKKGERKTKKKYVTKYTHYLTNFEKKKGGTGI